jgi:hypothetical protein
MVRAIKQGPAETSPPDETVFIGPQATQPAE